MKRRLMGIVGLLFFTVSFMPLSGVKAQKYTIKFATLAPEGTTWLKVMQEFDTELRNQTNGEVGFKIYAGGILGDEKDVLRKIRIGQLHAGGFTGVGMGEIAASVRILDTPFLFRNTTEIDQIYENLTDVFAESFSRNGYEFLGWAEVGFVYVFTKEKAQSLDDLRKLKMWVWQGDEVAEATFKVFGLNPVPLSVIDVMTALQTNMVDGVYTSPLAAVSLQWFTKVKYMMKVPLANAAGAVLISKRMFNKLPPAHQRTLKNLAQKYFKKLTLLSRKDNEKAVESLVKNGIQIISPPDSATLESYYQLGAKARAALVGKFYSQELLQRVESVLVEMRSNSAKN